MKLLSRGSEGFIYLVEADEFKIGIPKYIVKIRPERKYRHKLIDSSLRKYRTRREYKILTKAKSLGINVPEVYKVNEKEFWIAMQYIEGNTLTLNSFLKHLEKAAEIVANLHKANIIHGDLHPKNFIFSNELYIIDFGLSFISKRIEDKAVDLFELRKLLKESWDKFAEVYKKNYEEGNEVLKKLEEIERRGRYKMQI